MSGVPIKPSDIPAAKQKHTPPQVIDIFNELIAKHFNEGRSVVKQSDVVSEIERRVEGPDTDQMRAHWRQNVVMPWLNVESIYRAAGWKVAYDKPAYNEPGGATFIFTPSEEQ